MSDKDNYKWILSTKDITLSCFEEESYMVRHISSESKSMGALFLYQGDVTPFDIINIYSEAKAKLNLHELLDTGLTCWVTRSQWFNSFEVPIQRSVSVLNNSIAIKTNFDDISNKVCTIVLIYFANYVNLNLMDINYYSNK